MELKGVHHVSALTARVQGNLTFYTQTMGMRLVKKSVNQDDTSSYHLFYADKLGSPGTDLTFFDLPYAGPNHPGTRSISAVGLRVPDEEALRYWKDRLTQLHVEHEEIVPRKGRPSMALRDFEGQRLILVADGDEKGVQGGTPWEKSPVPAPYAIRGLGPVKLTVRDPERSARVLTDMMGFKEAGSYPNSVPSQPDIVVFSTGEGGTGAEIHLEERQDLPVENLGRGGVHHVAFRVPNILEHDAWLARLEAAGMRTSGIVDRFYFRSIYFREPNGILYELATDGPGFATDESPDHLGERLALPPFLEPYRASIEAKLRPLDPVPTA